MNEKPENCPVHRLYLTGQKERLAEPFPYLKKKGFSVRTIGKGDGHSSLLNTQEQLLVKGVRGALYLPHMHPFDEGADAQLRVLGLMDHIALSQLLSDGRQRYLNALFEHCGLKRIEVRFDFAESKDVIQTFGAERSGSGTGKWFSKIYVYKKGEEAEHTPAILLLLPTDTKK